MKSSSGSGRVLESNCSRSQCLWAASDQLSLTASPLLLGALPELREHEFEVIRVFTPLFSRRASRGRQPGIRNFSTHLLQDFTGNVQEVFKENVFHSRSICRTSKRFGIGKRLVKDTPTHRYKPGTKIVKPVIGAATCDDVCRTPQLPAVRSAQKVAHDPAELNNLVCWKCGKQVFQGLSLTIHVPIRLIWLKIFSRFLDDLPELVYVHPAPLI